MNPGNKIIDSGDLRKYRAEIPNIIFVLGLTPFELTLYVYLKRVAGDGGVCFKANDTIAEETNMSAGMVSKVKESLKRRHLLLKNKPLIVVEEEPNPRGGKPLHHIRLVNIWADNFAYFGQQASSQDELASSPHERASSHGEVASSPHEVKKEPREERTHEEVGARAGAPPPPRPAADIPDPFAHPAVAEYVRAMKPDPGLSINQAELISSRVVNMAVWKRVLMIFAGNEHRGRDGRARYVGNALDRYDAEVEKLPPEQRAGARAAPRQPPETAEQKQARLARVAQDRAAKQGQQQRGVR